MKYALSVVVIILLIVLHLSEERHTDSRVELLESLKKQLVLKKKFGKLQDEHITTLENYRDDLITLDSLTTIHIKCIEDEL